MRAGMSSLIKQLDDNDPILLLTTMSTLGKLLTHGELRPDTIMTSLMCLSRQIS